MIQKGKPLEDTLAELERGAVSIDDIPRIQVMFDGERFFSMNNRRLWVFKELAKKGKLKLVPVQIETPKSSTQKKLGLSLRNRELPLITSLLLRSSSSSSSSSRRVTSQEHTVTRSEISAPTEETNESSNDHNNRRQR
jgi:hypothetical protein